MTEKNLGVLRVAKTKIDRTLLMAQTKTSETDARALKTKAARATARSKSLEVYRTLLVHLLEESRAAKERRHTCLLKNVAATTADCFWAREMTDHPNVLEEECPGRVGSIADAATHICPECGVPAPVVMHAVTVDYNGRDDEFEEKRTLYAFCMSCQVATQISSHQDFTGFRSPKL